MFVQEIMTTAVLTVPPGMAIRDACRVMHDRNIRHLPVVAGDRLVGVVTDRDIHGATSSLCIEPQPPQGTVSDVMARDVRTAHPLDSVEEAARTMRSLKIGCLPVVDGDSLVGIITGIDLLDALLRLTGVDKPSGRLELRQADRPGELARLASMLASRRINIHSILTYPDAERKMRTVLRVDTLETRPLADALRREGFDVIWPAAKPWQH